MSANIFAYGLLQHPAVLQQLLPRLPDLQPAYIEGYVRRTLNYPGFNPCAMAVEQAGQRLQGVLLGGVDEEALAILDKFEALEQGIYRRETIEAVTEGGARVCELYTVGHALTDEHVGELWCEQNFLREHLQDYIDRVVPAVKVEMNL